MVTMSQAIKEPFREGGGGDVGRLGGRDGRL